MIDFEKLLNKKQLEAVLETEDPILVLSASFFGKTRVITYRIANLFQKGVQQINNLAVSFTNIAVGEMKERVFNLIRDKAKTILISTFHSLCV